MRFLNSKKNTALKEEDMLGKRLSSSLSDNVDTLKNLYDRCSDFVLREFVFGRQEKIKGAIIFFDGLIAKEEVEANILQPLLMELNMLEDPDKEPLTLDIIRKGLICSSEIKEVETLDEVFLHVGSGDTVVLIDNYPRAITAGTRSWAGRGISYPPNESVIHGPKEAFCETLRFNTALLRRRLRSPRLKMESFQIGRLSRTDVVLTYIEGLAKPELVADIRQRLKAIEIDAVLDTNYIQELIEEKRYSLFHQVMDTERPDRVLGSLLEGRLAIMVDGSPTAIILPITISMFLTVGEDYYMRYASATFFRLLRFLAVVFSITLPSFYVAVITYHQELIPTQLLVTILNARQPVPYPAVVEALLMELTFEFLREAGMRLPQAVGPAVSIVGGLVLGDAAVKAGLVSTPMVVVVAFTGICSFVIPNFRVSTALRLIRFPFLFLGGFLGFFGIALGIIALLIQLGSMESFGIPYTEPFAPLNLNSWGDTIARRPWLLAKTGGGIIGTASKASTLETGRDKA